MGAPIHRTTDWQSDRYDMIIDARSPAEFADDHISGAVNMPSLSDDEREIVGTIYKQKSAFEARKIGASMTAKNIATHIEAHLADKPAGFTPLIHCWRGGQRSRAFAQICSEIGWTCYVLEGGYKFYRTQVLDNLKTLPEQFRYIIIAGRTGSAKTKLLRALGSRGAQILDLEGLAHHKGSLLGGLSEPQPSQKLFESCLVGKLSGFDKDRPVFVESESSRIGEVHIPKLLWHEMIHAPVIMIEVDRQQRAEYLVSEYPHLLSDQTDLNRLIDGMIYRHGHAETGKWRELMRQHDWVSLSHALLERHYDPAYDQSVTRHERPVAGIVSMASITQTDISGCADEILTIAQQLAG